MVDKNFSLPFIILIYNYVQTNQSSRYSDGLKLLGSWSNNCNLLHSVTFDTLLIVETLLDVAPVKLRLPGGLLFRKPSLCLVMLGNHFKKDKQ